MSEVSVAGFWPARFRNSGFRLKGTNLAVCLRAQNRVVLTRISPVIAVRPVPLFVVGGSDPSGEGTALGCLQWKSLTTIPEK